MSAKVELNNVKSRFLPIPESASLGLEPEAKITDFEIIKELFILIRTMHVRFNCYYLFFYFYNKSFISLNMSHVPLTLG